LHGNGDKIHSLGSELGYVKRENSQNQHIHRAYPKASQLIFVLYYPIYYLNFSSSKHSQHQAKR
jgi:hypothetical protein